MTGQASFELVLNEGQILLLDPNDAHQTGLIVDQPQKIRKAVFKVKI
ncbi:YhcH/YjgK/YiaL family protein [Streptococcus pasteurianus]|nr:YhcH/YjgK/YiaL family protein [Streptococcus pasteurianus]WCQ69485.1 YhcH/YjgK/YiaL family protein [Streptococcus pasteurianus]